MWGGVGLTAGSDPFSKAFQLERFHQSCTSKPGPAQLPLSGDLLVLLFRPLLQGESQPRAMSAS